MTDWKPIHTAPRDGTQIIICSEYSEDIAVARWNDRTKSWRCVSDGADVIEYQSDFGTEYRNYDVPSHWAPAPKPFRAKPETFYADDEPLTPADQAKIDAAWERHKAALNADVVCDHDWREYATSDLGGDRTEVFCTKCNVSGERDDKTAAVFWPAT
jgi:hypothetical protein